MKETFLFPSGGSMKKKGIKLVKYINFIRENNYIMQKNVYTLYLFVQLIIPLILIFLITHSHVEGGKSYRGKHIKWEGVVARIQNRPYGY